MLGVTFILVGGVLLVVGALAATNWIDEGTDHPFFSLAFLSMVLGPLLGGGILLLFGLMEYW
ncbi:MAG: hypothetical protein K8S55_02255 [Phycisphaerae bacterium]|nr:hypothetical protein [Phycisphaerae bacterium]